MFKEIVARRRFETVRGPEALPREETGPEVRQRSVLVKEANQRNRNSGKEVKYSVPDIVTNVKHRAEEAGAARKEGKPALLTALKRTGVLHTTYV